MVYVGHTAYTRPSKMSFERSEQLIPILDHLSANDRLLFQSIRARVLGDLTAKGIGHSSMALVLVHQGLKEALTKRGNDILSEIRRVLDGAYVDNCDQLQEDLKAELTTRLRAAATLASSELEDLRSHLRMLPPLQNMPLPGALLRDFETMTPKLSAEIDLFCRKLYDAQTPRSFLKESKMEISARTEQPESPPLVFISYSHDSKEHRAWVAAFANSLRQKGVEVLLDQFDIKPGDNIPQFMNDSVRNADRVLMICTEIYVRKANDGEGGAGYEALIVTSELIKDLGQNKFIPIVRQTSGTTEVPTCLSGRSYIKLNDGSEYEAQFEELLKTLHNIPLVAKSPLGPNPFAAKTFEGEESRARRENRRIEFADAIASPEAAFQFALDVARANDNLAWRRLLKASREQGVKKLQEVAEETTQGDFLRRSPKEEELQEIAFRCLSCYSTFAACLLAGVTTENPNFANQLSWIDTILQQPEWPSQGIVFWVDIPELIFFVLQAFVGGNLMQTNNIETAFKLATSGITTRRDTEAKPVFKQTRLNGWPDSLSHNCTVSFRFLDSLIDRWSWLTEPFASAIDARSAMTAYYFLLSFLDFITLLKTDCDLTKQLIVSVPLNFTFGSPEAQKAAYRLLLANREFLKQLLAKNGISREGFGAGWQDWMKQTVSFVNPWGEFRTLANQSLAVDLFKDSYEL